MSTNHARPELPTLPPSLPSVLRDTEELPIANVVDPSQLPESFAPQPQAQQQGADGGDSSTPAVTGDGQQVANMATTPFAVEPLIGSSMTLWESEQGARRTTRQGRDDKPLPSPGVFTVRAAAPSDGGVAPPAPSEPSQHASGTGQLPWDYLESAGHSDTGSTLTSTSQLLGRPNLLMRLFRHPAHTQSAPVTPQNHAPGADNIRRRSLAEAMIIQLVGPRAPGRAK